MGRYDLSSALGEFRTKASFSMSDELLSRFDEANAFDRENKSISSEMCLWEVGIPTSFPFSPRPLKRA